jgi:hypothetical protein
MFFAANKVDFVSDNRSKKKSSVLTTKTQKRVLKKKRIVLKIRKFLKTSGLLKETKHSTKKK